MRYRTLIRRWERTRGCASVEKADESHVSLREGRIRAEQFDGVMTGGFQDRLSIVVVDVVLVCIVVFAGVQYRDDWNLLHLEHVLLLSLHRADHR